MRASSVHAPNQDDERGGCVTGLIRTRRSLNTHDQSDEMKSNVILEKGRRNRKFPKFKRKGNDDRLLEEIEENE